MDGMPVRISMDLASRGVATRVAVGGADPTFTLRRESLRERMGLTTERWIIPSAATQWARTNDVLTGDADFDARIDLHGPVPALMAALDPEARTLVLDVVEGWDGRVEGGEVVVETVRDLSVPGRLAALVRTVHALGLALRPRTPEEVLRKLIANYRCMKSPHVRAMLLGTLGGAFPGDPEMLALSREALDDKTYDWIPMNGAANLGPVGVPAYWRILADPAQRESIHAMCVRHLGFLLPEEEAESFLLDALSDRRDAVAASAARVLEERAGTARSVPKLTETAEQHTSADVRKAAQKALDAIAVKLEGVEPGGLALAPAGEYGQLSRAEAPQPSIRASTADRAGER
jgi:hypothetical protein